MGICGSKIAQVTHIVAPVAVPVAESMAEPTPAVVSEPDPDLMLPPDSEPLTFHSAPIPLSPIVEEIESSPIRIPRTVSAIEHYKYSAGLIFKPENSMLPNTPRSTSARDQMTAGS